jgi:hypothetical protein
MRPRQPESPRHTRPRSTVTGMGNAARIATRQGTVTVTAEAVKIPRTAGTALAGAGGWSSLFRVTRVIAAEDVREVFISGRDRQYVTGRRAAGVVLTGGVALLAPSRMRGTLVIATVSGGVYEFALLRRNAKRPEAIAAAFAARGYRVRLHVQAGKLR